MALTGVEIFKMLPKTNCKKCGFPTCLAFAMKLAQRQASIESCPDVSADVKAQLGEAAAPPVKTIVIGSGDKAIKLGDETVMFRHEKKFVNPCAFAVEIKDTASEADIKATVADVVASEMERVGQKLRIDMVCITNASGDAAKFAAAAKAVAAAAPSLPVMLSTSSADAAKAALAAFAGKKPVLHGANASNLDAMTAAAKEAGATLGVAGTLEELSELTEKVKAAGVADMVLDTNAKTAGQMLKDNTLVRRAAIKKTFKPLGYPVVSFAQRDDAMLETLVASVGIAKYSSIIVMSSVQRWKSLALFTLRQNIYTDPQVPMQVEQKIYKIGDVTDKSPLLITTNFSLTYFIVSGEVENSKVPTRLAVMDCEGLSVLTAWAAGKFTAGKIAQFIKDSGVENEMATKELTLPGYVAILSGALEDKLEGWKIIVGPREANQLPVYLKSK